VRLGAVHLPTSTVVSLSVEGGWSHATHDVIGRKPRRQFIAPRARSVSIACYFHVDLVDDPATLVAELEELGAAAEVVPVQSDYGDLLGHFVLESVRVTPRWTLPDGRLLAAQVHIELGDEEDEERPAPRPAIEGSPARTASAQSAEDTSRAPGSVPTAEIARL
jgi:phage protein U